MAKGKRENYRKVLEGHLEACEASNYVLKLSDSNWKNAK